MMSLHKVSAGDGYEYYTKEVSRNDEVKKHGEKLTDYYLETGNPPGEWIGGGLDNLGLKGEVTEEQMRHLYGEGVNPFADDIVRSELKAGKSIDEALKGIKLGRAYYKYSTDGSADGGSLKADIDARLTSKQSELGRDLTPDERSQIKLEAGSELFKTVKGRTAGNADELAKFVDAKLRGPAQSTAGFDLTFSPQKSVSTLWALTDPTTAKEIEAAHRTAVETSIKWVEKEAIRTRVGCNGVGQIDVAGGVVAARFRHHDSREGDPQLHDHVVVSNKVKGSDGQWRSIDGALLYKATVASSETYNSTLMDELNRRLGLTFSPRDMGDGKRPVMEIDGVPRELLDLFSSRRAHIEHRLNQLVDDYRTTHGHDPSADVHKRLAQQATLETRPKKERGQTLGDRRSGWLSQALSVVGGQGIARVQQLVKRDEPRARFDVDLDGVDRLAADVIYEVSQRRSTWSVRHLTAEANRQISLQSGGREVRDGLVDAVVERAQTGYSVQITSDPDYLPESDGLTRADGQSIYRSHASEVFTSPGILDAEERLLDLGSEQAQPLVSPRSFDKTLDRLRQDPTFKLSPEQEMLARDFASGQTTLRVGIGPAGAGKTTAMRTVVEAVHDAGGSVIALAPSRQAANVMTGDLGVKADTLQSFILADKPIPEGSLILVDEAGMAGTPTLNQVVSKATEAGAHVRLIGDYRQLSAVESGGSFRLLHESLGGVELTQLFRFSDEGEAAASLHLRDAPAGDKNVFDWYLDNQRLVAGRAETMAGEVFTAWQNDADDGRDVLMIATTRASVDALNREAQAHRVSTGDVNLDNTVDLRETSTDPGVTEAQHLESDVSTEPAQSVAGIGDVIVARQNDRRLTVEGPSSAPFVANGSRWRITDITENGDALVESTTKTGGHTVLPAAYLKENAELGYASTVHQSQGATVDAAYALLDTATRREAAYVALTRSRDMNKAFLAADDGVSVRGAAEGIAGNTDPARAAFSEIREALTNEANPAGVAEVYRDVLGRVSESRMEPHLVAAGLDVDDLKTSSAYHVLASRLLAAEQDGHSIDQLVRDIAAPSSLDPKDPPRDMAALLVWRTDQYIEQHPTEAPDPAPDGLPVWLAPPAPLNDPDLTPQQAGDLSRLRGRLADQIEELGDRIETDPPTWARKIEPDDPAARAQWIGTAREVQAWRLVNGYGDERQAMPNPDAMPDKAQPGERQLAARVDRLRTQPGTSAGLPGRPGEVNSASQDAIRRRAQQIRSSTAGSDDSRAKIAAAKARAEAAEKRRREAAQRRTAGPKPEQRRGPRRGY